uniref:nuclear cap-binding protein subunit 3 n=1 Tax=Halichoerus grypus TaxID=9711 RepID=UPI00165906F9|nr:nuclear cap-binding protein subunit 3 [Halichoerus grypus]XP_045727225.1 nuclear cap-binding protein subunit 3-like [Mirounga angustirostris]
MAAVRGLRVSVKAEAPAGPALGLPSPEADSGLERGEPEPMEVEEGELEIVPVRRSLKELIPDTSRRYENKAGSFITGIDVTSKEAIEKKEQRAKRFHFRSEVNLAQRNVALDRDMMKKGTMCWGVFFHISPENGFSLPWPCASGLALHVQSSSKHSQRKGLAKPPFLR